MWEETNLWESLVMCLHISCWRRRLQCVLSYQAHLPSQEVGAADKMLESEFGY